MTCTVFKVHVCTFLIRLRVCVNLVVRTVRNGHMMWFWRVGLMMIRVIVAFSVRLANIKGLQVDQVMWRWNVLVGLSSNTTG